MRAFLFFSIVTGLMAAFWFSNRKASEEACESQNLSQVVFPEPIPAVEEKPLAQEKAPQIQPEASKEKVVSGEEVQKITPEKILPPSAPCVEKKEQAPLAEVKKEEAPLAEVKKEETVLGAEKKEEVLVVEERKEVPVAEIKNELAQEEKNEKGSESAVYTEALQEKADSEAPEIVSYEAEEVPRSCCEEVAEPVCPPKKWYFEFKPGYYYLTDKMMRQFYDNGGFTFRGEFGYRFWKPFIVWVDGSYFQKSGQMLGGTESVEIKLASLTLGLKAIYYFNDYVAAYAGAGPRLFLMMIKNHSDFIRNEDNAFGIGAGFNGGFWFFPIPRWKNIFLDLFGDYSWKELEVEEDEGSSTDNDVNVSGITAGLGIGIRF